MNKDQLVNNAAAEAVGLVQEFRGLGRVLNDVHLQVKAGTVVGLLGPNGAGKSTLIRTLCRLLRPDSGHWAPHPDRHQLGVLIDEPSLHRWMTVRAELRYWCRVKNLSLAEINTVAKIVGLDDRLGSRIRTLSHGMRQRLAVAIALLGSPPVIVLDEPFNGLDPLQVEHLRNVIRQQAERGAAVLVTTHQLDEVRRCCDEIVIMNRGKVVAKKNLRVPSALKVITIADRDTDKLSLAAQGLPGKPRSSTEFIVSDCDLNDVMASLVAQGVVPVNVRDDSDELADLYRKMVAIP